MVIVAVGQFAATEHPDDNVEVIRRLAADAHRRGAALLVLPEYSAFTARTFGAGVVEHAQPVDGPFGATISTIAKDHELAIVAGMAEEIPDHHRAFNTLLMVHPDGSLAGTYRKLHLFDALGFTESDWIEAGDPSDAPTLTVDGLRVGVQTCYDLRFPETTRWLVDAGAEVVAVAAQWVPGPLKEDQWATLLRARAIESSVYVAAAGQSAPAGSGGSEIIDPMGVAVAALGERVGVAAAAIDPARIEQVRTANPVLTARRFRIVADGS